MKAIILALVFVTSMGVSDAATDPTIVASITTKWEYKQVRWDSKTDSVTMQAQLDSLGEQGWELSGMIARRSPEGNDILLFKRSKDSDDASIEFIEALNLAIVRGSKTAVEKTLSQIQAVKESAKLKKNP